jgi:hypothetical protein
MIEVEIQSLGDLLSYLAETQNDMEPLWFRGQRDSSWDVQAGLWRCQATGTPYTLADEHNFTHRFRTRAALRRSSSPDYHDQAAWLALMQHYGLPTRLLDWSRSPLIAAFFALWEFPSTGAAGYEAQSAATIWLLRPHRLNYDQAGFVHTPALDSKDCEFLVSQAFFNSRRPPRKNAPMSVMAAMASETDMRMFVQQGCFTIHSPNSPALNMLTGADEFMQKLVVPRSRVLAMAREVRLAGISEGDIFPDLEHLSRELVLQWPAGSVRGDKGGRVWH